MNKQSKLIWASLLALGIFLNGCTTLFNATVTIKDAGDSISGEYAALFKKGVISTEVDAQAELIHANYRKAMGTLAVALEAYKVTGDEAPVIATLRAVKDAIGPLIDIIASYIPQEKATKLRTNLNKASAQ